MLIALAVLGAGYLFYGRWLAKKWGIDPKAKTPAYEMEDGVDYTPTAPGVVFGHQFASIAGAGPINGPIQAAIFGWVPVLLWVLVGGLFFGAVQDFVSMYASVRNKGRTIGYIIELYIGKIAEETALPIAIEGTRDILAAGFGGQGVLTLGKVLARLALDAHLQATWMPSYGPEMRGGVCRCHIKLSKHAIACPVVDRPDLFFAFNQPSFDTFSPHVAPNGLIIYDSDMVRCPESCQNAICQCALETFFCSNYIFAWNITTFNIIYKL